MDDDFLIPQPIPISAILAELRTWMHGWEYYE